MEQSFESFLVEKVAIGDLTFLDRVNDLIDAHLIQFKSSGAAASMVAAERQRLEIVFSQRMPDTDLAHTVLKVIQHR